MALSSVTRSVTCTENLTFRLDQLMLLIHIHINGREATNCRNDPRRRRRRETDLPAAQTCFSGHRAPSTLGWQKAPNTTATAAAGRKEKRFRQTKEGPLATNMLHLMIILIQKKKLDGFGNLRVPLLPAATRWPLFGQQADTFHRA